MDRNGRILGCCDNAKPRTEIKEKKKKNDTLLVIVLSHLSLSYK